MNKHAEINNLTVVDNLAGTPLTGLVLAVNDHYVLQSAGRKNVRIHAIDANDEENLMMPAEIDSLYPKASPGQLAWRGLKQ
ncbi:MAG: hypothetical protein HHJ09_05025 [Glaciimonas sp.]|nr:hypothetical protein [Glaciimonas sp.]